jgi:hypothetical protein
MQKSMFAFASPAEPGNPALLGAQRAEGVRSAGGTCLRKQARAGARQ